MKDLLILLAVLAAADMIIIWACCIRAGVYDDQAGLNDEGETKYEHNES